MLGGYVGSRAGCVGRDSCWVGNVCSNRVMGGTRL